MGDTATGSWGSRELGGYIRREESRFEQVFREAGERVALMKEVRSLPDSLVKRATELLQLLKAGRRIYSPSPRGR